MFKGKILDYPQLPGKERELIIEIDFPGEGDVNYPLIHLNLVDIKIFFTRLLAPRIRQFSETS
jgi:hypothetical protein